MLGSIIAWVIQHASLIRVSALQHWQDFDEDWKSGISQPPVAVSNVHGR